MADQYNAPMGGPSYYTQFEAAELERQEKALAADKERSKNDRICTCEGRTAGFFVDRCPLHGTFATTKD